MNNTFKKLFAPIRAEEALKERTRTFLAEKTRGYTRADAEGGRYSLCAACACALFLVLLGRWLYFTPTVEISIDINPSIELGINRFDQVIFVNGFNEDGQELSSTLHLKHKNYTKALEEILHHGHIEALLAGNEVMTITVVGPEGQQAAKILSGVEACAAKQHNTYCYFAPPEEIAAAHESGLSCGKYRAFLELQQLDPSITPEAVQGMSMREIRERIQLLGAGNANGPSPYHGQGNGHHGYGGPHGGGWRGGKDES